MPLQVYFHRSPEQPTPPLLDTVQMLYCIVRRVDLAVTCMDGNAPPQHFLLRIRLAVVVADESLAPRAHVKRLGQQLQRSSMCTQYRIINDTIYIL